MPISHPPVDRIVVGLQVGLQVLFGLLLVFVVVLAFLQAGPGTLAIVVVAVAIAITYLLVLLAHGVADPRRRMLARCAWIAALTAEWVVLLFLSPFAAYLVFPLFFLYLDVLPAAWGVLAVVFTTATAVVGLGLRTEWTVGGVLGPIVGAGVALLLGGAYRALRRESAEHARLYSDLLATQGRLAVAEREAGVLAERERLARDIHDTVAQSLSSIALLLSAVERATPDAPGIAEIRLARETASASLAETRSLIRELTPPALSEQSLPAALRRLAAGAWSRAGLDIEVRAAEGLALPMPVQTALLRVAQGAMANVLAHAHARHVEIALTVDATSVVLTISDDGDGFDPDAVLASDAPRRPDAFGLRATRERVEQLGGSAEVRSAPGAGTSVRVRLPREAA